MRQLFLASALFFLAGLAHAAPDTVIQSDWAPVVSSTPIYKQVNTPRRHCWTEQVTTEDGTPAEHGFGGAIIGAIAGDKMANQGNSGPVQQTREERHCRSVDNWSRQLAG